MPLASSEDNLAILVGTMQLGSCTWSVLLHMMTSSSSAVKGNVRRGENSFSNDRPGPAIVAALPRDNGRVEALDDEQ